MNETSPEIIQERYLIPDKNDNGIFTSLNFPSNAPTDHRFTLKLRTQIGYRISLVFPKLLLSDGPSCSDTYLQVLDDSLGPQNVKLISNVSCGQHKRCRPFVSALNRVSITFVVGTEDNSSKFLGKYSVIKGKKKLFRI